MSHGIISVQVPSLIIGCCCGWVRQPMGDRVACSKPTETSYPHGSRVLQLSQKSMDSLGHNWKAQWEGLTFFFFFFNTKWDQHLDGPGSGPASSCVSAMLWLVESITLFSSTCFQIASSVSLCCSGFFCNLCFLTGIMFHFCLQIQRQKNYQNPLALGREKCPQVPWACNVMNNQLAQE